MADVIFEVVREPIGKHLGDEDRFRFEGVFFCPIDPAIQIKPGTNLVLTPSTDLPFVLTQHGKIPQDYLDKLNDGTGFFIPVSYEQNEDEPLAAFLARVQSVYLSTCQAEEARLRTRYSNTGKGYPAT